MTTLDKLVIQGIRSYDPAGSATIAFWRPLTLITGENGAGKTTIIEALRYACTGRCPGHGFVHDAKLAGNASVTGRVVLRFRTAPPRQELCTVLRTLSVTAQSTRSGLAEFAHDGGGKTSGATAVNEVVPAVMGVSVPVLDYVMFCHQEDSNWPLSAGAELERRFEEIFSATRYARALDTLHKVRKGLVQHAPALAERLRALRTLHAQLDGLRRSIADADARAADKRAQIAALERDAAARTAAVDRLARALAAHQHVADQERCLAGQLATAREHARALAAALDEHSRAPASTPDAQLEREHAQVAAALRTLAESADLRALADLEARVRDAARDVQRLHDTLVRLRGCEREAADRADACAARCLAFARECLADDAVRALEALDRGDAARLQAETLRGAQGVLDGAQARHSAAVQQRQDALAPVRQQLDALRGAVSKLQGQIDSGTHSAKETAERLGYEQDMVEEKKKELGESERAAAQCREQEAVLAALEADAAARRAAIAQNMEGLANDERELRSRCAELQRQLTFAKQCLPLHTKVEHMQSQYTRTKTDFDELCRSADLTGPLGSCAGKSVREITQMYRTAYRTTSDSLNKADEDKKEQDKKVNSLEVREREMLNELQELTKERDAKARTLAQVVDKLCEAPVKKRGAKKSAPDWRKFPELLQEKEAAMKKTEKKLILATATEELYRKFIKSATKTCCCPLCERRLGTTDGVTLPDFTSKLEDVIKALPAASAIEESKAELARQQQVAAELHAVEAVWHRWAQLDSEEIPKRERALQEVRESLRAANQDVPQLTQVYENASKVWARLGRAKLVLDQLRRLEPKLAEEGDELESAQEALDRMIKKEDGGSAGSDAGAMLDIGAISTALVEAQRKHQGVSDQIARCHEEQNALNGQVQQQRDVVAALRSKSLETVKLQAEVSQMERELGEKEQSLKKTQEGIERARQEQKEATAQLDAVSRQEQQLSTEHDAAIAQLGSECQKLHVAIERFKVETDQTLEQVQQLRSQAAGIASAKQSKQEAAARRDAAQTQLAALKTQVQNQDSAKRDLELRQKVLSSNLQLRRSMAEVSSLEQQVQALRSNPDYLDSAAAAQAQSEHAQAQQQLSAAVAKASEEKGALRVLEDTLQQLRADELRPELQSAPEDYRRCLIEKETNDIMQEDLDKYEKELDKALILFHQTKMESINRRVTELWQATYRNADIDTIRIKSEVERRTVTGKKTESGRGTRYSVVMVKDGVEMDMRGRCSAGQKVLACIVIRIALAEIFCLNCGILALDEPTTNLDRRNVDSLARALTALVESQRRNTSFQLVIITHDQEFADAFHCERWYNVSKPDRNQFSVITLYGSGGGSGGGRLPPAIRGADDGPQRGGFEENDDDDDDDDFVDNKSRSSQMSVPWRG